MTGRFTPLLRSLGLALAAGVGVAGLAGVLLLLAGHALAGGPTEFDRAILLGLRHADAQGRWLGIATDVTALGSGPVLTLIVAIVAGGLMLERRWRSAILLAGASESLGRAVDLVKAAVARPRPELVPHWIAVGNWSYPSAHSADSAVVALLLALLARRSWPGRGGVYAAAVAAMLVAAIGCSRVYLGVHWPSDVLAGWGFGAAWGLGWWWAIGPSGARE